MENLQIKGREEISEKVSLGMNHWNTEGRYVCKHVPGSYAAVERDFLFVSFVEIEEDSVLYSDHGEWIMHSQKFLCLYSGW
ncbi:hypothetical protein SAMN04488054_1384 [Salibacterium qingdaonense]|uniref:Uncharacterized protein n=1 Tax=Salibacterium qingdaonense TaxID=266892 RepID=A0A1I4Q8A5_9BACI|nr:hypothetical protein SAMN04488054_1384 [Salibacterium qingdaonense]